MYYFATVHVHGAVHKERRVLMAGQKDIKNKEEILQLLGAIWEPEKVAITYCWEHRKGQGPITKENQLTDQTRNVT